ncbi:L-lactate dehydrogenase [Terrilactibacillus laevilacticus]|uniref:L-lactate dehydrogenase n=1 Tax=Terrilactibacillus laevilacticus TaxID=1380157 RepID=A0ABW5PSN9_9BACI|nr:L-lactate dehydrogenase [Terrilactibacillus laevilacticus]
METKKRKIGIIGVGNVGTAAATAILHNNIADELLLIDCDKKRAEGEAMDYLDSIEFNTSRTYVKAANLEEAASCDILLISVADPSTIPSSSRLELLQESASIIKDVVPNLKKLGFTGIYIVATNPCDIITYLTWTLSGLPRYQVIGTGTALDSARFRRLLSQELKNINPETIQGYTLGEHGDSQFGVWSHVTIGGQPLDEFENQTGVQLDRNAIVEKTRSLGWDIHTRKGCTQFGIGNVLAYFAKIILEDAKSITPASCILDGEYGFDDLSIGVPAVIGRRGVERILTLQLTDKEYREFITSSQVIKNYISELNSIKID